MLEKSCRWWPIWYLLFFCHGSEGQLQWVVKEKVTAYGQNLILFCPVDSCCSEPAGWFVGNKTIIIDVKTFSNDPKVKYHGTYNKDGFGVVIRNLSKADLNVTYRCIYGFDKSTPKYLLHGDVFRENKNECLDNNGGCSQYCRNLNGSYECYCQDGLVLSSDNTTCLDKNECLDNNGGCSQYCRNLNGSYECYCQDGLVLSSDNTTCLDKNECLDNNGGCSQYCRNLNGSYECYCQDGLVLSSDNTTCLDKNECLDNNGGCSQYCRNLNGSYECYCQDGLVLSSDNTTCLDVPDKDKEIDTAAIVWYIIVGIVVVCIIGIGMVYYVYRSRIRNKRQKQTGTEEEMEVLENQQDEADSLSKEGNNFLHLYFLCQKIATQAVRHYFDSNVPELGLFLMQHKSDLTSNSVYKCSSEQKAILFPGGHVAVDSADFDFTLLYKLIRNLVTGIPAPTRGWGIPPLPTHINETDDIERIRDLRNELAQNSEFEICDTDFSTHWTDLSQAIDRLSKGSLSTDVKSMRTKKFDKFIINEMEEDIRKELKEIREEFHIINTRHIPLHIKKGHNEQIKRWQIEDKPFYAETGGYTAASKMVKSENYMTIIGEPGSGKTSTARHIALQLKNQGWEVVPVCKLEDIIQYGDRDHQQVFVLDDVLGIFAVDMNNYNYIISHEEQIFSTIGKTSKLLFTCRKSVYKEALVLELFVTKNVIDLQSKRNQLTETEKMAICKYHCEAKGVNPDLYTSLSFTKANHMFPLLCKLFSKEKQYQRLGERFFNKPFDYCISVLDKLLENNSIQYAVLVLCLVNEGKLSVKGLPDKHMRRKVFDCCGVNLDTPVKKIKDAINHMSETYFTKLDTEYTFSHDFIFEVVAFHYGRQNQEQILKYLSSSYIANKVTVYEQDSNEDHCIQISEDMYSQLAERLYKDIQSSNLFDVFMNKSLKHGAFLDVFKGMLKTKPFDEFESLILREHGNVYHIMQKIAHFEYIIERRVGFIAECHRLYLLFDWDHYRNSDFKGGVRVISWIINYGHTHLLKEIVKHVECNKHNISLIFGSNLMENIRLLTLGCYSNTSDMVELMLEYIDSKCINMDYSTSFDIANFVPRIYTPLMVACATGNLCIVKALLRNKADVNECSTLKETPLLIAISYGHADVVRCLLSSGADVNLCNSFRRSPLYKASKKGHCDIVKYLVDHNADVNLYGANGQSPLYKASKKGHCDIVKYLVDHKADVNLYGANRQSPLYKASKKGHCDIVKYLVAHNAKVNLCDLQGQSPLFKASMEGHCDIVKYLVDHNAKVNLCDLQGQSPLFKASMEGHCDIVKYLVDHNADVNLCDLHGQSPLLKASMEGYCDIVKYLVANNADVNLTDIDDRSPLFPASKVGHYSIVHVLLQNGADVGYDSALDLALYYGHHDIVSLLIAHGALSAGNTKSQFKSISKRTNGNEIHSDNNALLNPCGYPEEKISHSKEKQEEKKEGIYVAKVQEGKKETVFTREQEEKEEIISTRETKE